MRKALVLLSGGQDSTTCLHWAKSKFDTVEAIGFFYGQRHAKEQELAVKIAADADVPFHIVGLEKVFGNSALVDPLQSTSGQHTINPSLPATFTAGRNIVFLAVAAGYAFNKEIQHLVTGVCETDFSGYPDCRMPFVQAMQEAVSLGLGTPLTIHTPLMYLKKAEIWKMAKDLGVLKVIVEDTMTDYNGDETMNEWGRGREDNPATVLRANGYRKAKELGWL